VGVPWAPLTPWAQICIHAELKEPDPSAPSKFQAWESFPETYTQYWKTKTPYQHRQDLVLSLEKEMATYENAQELPTWMNVLLLRALEQNACESDLGFCDNHSLTIGLTLERSGFDRDTQFLPINELSAFAQSLWTTLRENRQEGQPALAPLPAPETQKADLSKLILPPPAKPSAPGQGTPAAPPATDTLTQRRQTLTAFQTALSETHPLNHFFATVFPYPKALRFHLSRDGNVFRVTRIHGVLNTFMGRRHFAQPLQLSSESPLSETWCIDPSKLASLELASLDSLVDLPELPQVLPPQPGREKPVSRNLFQELSFDRMIETLQDWKHIWLMNQWAFIYLALFEEVDEMDAKDFFSRFQKLRLSQTKDLKSEGWIRLRDWINEGFKLSRIRDPVPMLAKAIEAEASPGSGSLLRAFNLLSSPLHELIMRAPVSLRLMPDSHNTYDSPIYLTGFQNIRQWIQKGTWILFLDTLSQIQPPQDANQTDRDAFRKDQTDIQNRMQKYKIQPRPNHPLPLNLDLPESETPSVDLSFFVAPKTVLQAYFGKLPFSVAFWRKSWGSGDSHRTFDTLLPRLSGIPRGFYLKPNDWSSWVLHLDAYKQAYNTDDSWLKSNTETLLRSLCPEREASPASVHPVCALKNHPALALYAHIAELASSIVVRLEPRGESRDLAISFETLGVFSQEQQDLGAHQRFPFPRQWLSNTLTFSDVQRTLLEGKPAPFKAGWPTLFQQPDAAVPPLRLERIVHSFSSQNQDVPYLVQTAIGEDGSLSLIVISKERPEKPPQHIQLPPSCTHRRWLAGDSETELQKTQATSVSLPRVVNLFELQPGDGHPPFTLTVVACDSGEILLYEDAHRLSCGDEDRSWHFHQAIWTQKNYKRFGEVQQFPNPFPFSYEETWDSEAKAYSLDPVRLGSGTESLTPKVHQGYMRGLLCRNAREWNDRKPSYYRDYPAIPGDSKDTQYRQMNTGTFWAVMKYELQNYLGTQEGVMTHIELLNSEVTERGLDIHLLFGTADGKAFPLSLSRRKLKPNHRPYWSLRVYPSPGSHGETIQFSFDLNGFPYMEHPRTPSQPGQVGRILSSALSKPMPGQVVASLFPEIQKAEQKPGTPQSRPQAAVPDTLNCQEFFKNTPFSFRYVFLLSQLGSSLGGSQTFLSRWIWPESHEFFSLNLGDQRYPCVTELMKRLGHGQITRVHLKAPKALKAVYAPPSPNLPAEAIQHYLPSLIAEGPLDGGYAFFTPEDLSGRPETEGLNSNWDSLFQMFANFMPSHYFYFGHRRSGRYGGLTSRSEWYSKGSYVFCEGFDRSAFSGSVLGESHHTLFTCSPETQTKDLSTRHWVFQPTFAYASSEANTDVLWTQGPRHLLNFIGEPSFDTSGPRKDHPKTHLSLFEPQVPKDESPEQFKDTWQKLKQAFPAFFDWTLGPRNILAFAHPGASQRQPSPSAKVEGDLGELKSKMHEDGGAIQKDFSDYLVQAFIRYFCSFATVGYDGDRFKINPGGDSDVFPVNHPEGLLGHPFKNSTKFIQEYAERGERRLFCEWLESGINNGFRSDVRNHYTFTQPVYQLKVSAYDEVMHLPAPQNPIELKLSAEESTDPTRVLEYQKVYGRLLDFARKSEALKNVMLLLQQSRSTGRASGWLRVLSYLKDDRFPDAFSDPDGFKDVFDRLMRDVGENLTPPTPLAELYLERLLALTDLTDMPSWLNKWISRLPPSVSEPEKTLLKRFLASFVIQTLSQQVIYTEFFAPLLRRLLEAPQLNLSADGSSFENLQKNVSQLMDALAFKKVSPKTGPALKSSLKEALSFTLNTPPGQPSRVEAAWNRLKLCEVSPDGSGLSCDSEWEEEKEKKGNSNLSDPAKQALIHYLNRSLTIVETLKTTGQKLSSHEAQRKAILDYSNRFVKKIYALGLFCKIDWPNTQADCEGKDARDEFMPLMFLVVAKRPDLHILKPDGTVAASSFSGTLRANGFNLFPTFQTDPYGSLKHLIGTFTFPNHLKSMIPSSLSPYSYPLPSEIQNHLTLAATPPPSDTVPFPSVPLRSPQSDDAWSFDAVSKSTLSLPFKYMEHPTLKPGTQGCGDWTDLNTLARITRGEKDDSSKLTPLGAKQLLFHRCSLQSTYPPLFSTLNPETGNPRLNDWHFMYLPSLMPLGKFLQMKLPFAQVNDTRYVYSVYDYRAIPDLMFQSLWDQWVTLPNARELFPAYLQDSEYRDLVRFLRPHVIRQEGLGKSEFSPYTFDPVRDLSNGVSKQFYADSEALPAHLKGTSPLKPYTDQLALEVLFPMISRYLWAPKTAGEFQTQEHPGFVERECLKKHLETQYDFSPRAQACVHLRHAQKLKDSYDWSSYYFGPTTVHELLKSFWNPPLKPTLEPYLIVKNLPSGSTTNQGWLLPNPAYWQNSHAQPEAILQTLKLDYKRLVQSEWDGYFHPESHTAYRWLKKIQPHPPVLASFLKAMKGWLDWMIEPSLKRPEGLETQKTRALTELESRSYFVKGYDPQGDSFYPRAVRTNPRADIFSKSKPQERHHGLLQQAQSLNFSLETDSDPYRIQGIQHPNPSQVLAFQGYGVPQDEKLVYPKSGNLEFVVQTLPLESPGISLRIVDSQAPAHVRAQGCMGVQCYRYVFDQETTPTGKIQWALGSKESTDHHDSTLSPATLGRILSLIQNLILAPGKDLQKLSKEDQAKLQLGPHFRVLVQIYEVMDTQLGSGKTARTAKTVSLDLVVQPRETPNQPVQESLGVLSMLVMGDPGIDPKQSETLHHQAFLNARIAGPMHPVRDVHGRNFICVPVLGTAPEDPPHPSRPAIPSTALSRGCFDLTRSTAPDQDPFQQALVEWVSGSER
jgi:hypothetical protein